MPLALISSKRFADHVTPAGHPERPERAGVLQAVAASFAEQGGAVIEPRSATDADLLRVHTQEHVDAIVATRGKAT
jgi:acetoin utilization deacetylase AcuC-like enzyme